MTDQEKSLDKSLDALKSGIQNRKVEKKSSQFYNDMEWWMLIAIMRDPKILSEISQIIPDPKILTGFTDDTPHRLIFQALTNLWDDAEEVNFEAVYAECENIRESNPMAESYSRKAIIELDFQSTIRKKMETDMNRIRGKFCAEQLLRRK